MLSHRSTQKGGVGQHFLGAEKRVVYQQQRDDARVKILPIIKYLYQVEGKSWKETDFQYRLNIYLYPYMNLALALREMAYIQTKVNLDFRITLITLY